MSLQTFSCSSKAQKQTTDTGMQSDKKILVPISPAPELRKKLPVPLLKLLTVSCIGLLRL